MKWPFALFAQKISQAYLSSPESFAALFAGVVALGVYVRTMAPTVTLELSGSLVTAADHMGVANSPGYPLWTLAAWFFQWALGGVRYLGHPNPAWGVAALSACAMAGASAVVAWLTALACRLRLVERSGGNLCTADVCWVAGTTSGLLFAFARAVWSQSVIAETHALNAFVIGLLLVFIFRWYMHGSTRDLLLAAFTAGLSVTTSYTSLFLLPAILVLVGSRDLRIPAGLLVLAILLKWSVRYLVHVPFIPGWLSVAIVLIMMLVAVVVRRVPRAGAVLACFALGLAFVLYMPVASSQNPPINWGNAQTMEGFLHMLRRGQYERVYPLNVFAHPAEYGVMLCTYLAGLARQFTWPVAALGVLSLGAFSSGDRRVREWVGFVIIAWAMMGPGLLVVLRPAADVQTQFLVRVHLIPSYLCYALLVGQGMGVLLDRLTRPMESRSTSVTPA